MQINTYELILDTETKHSSLQLKEALSYPGDTMYTPLAIFTMMMELFHLERMADEYVYLIAFNNKMKVLGLFQVSHGIGNASLIDPRGIFMRAVYIGASNLILVHNHPSGVTTPSKEDISVHKRLKEAGELMGIPIVDHVIIGSEGYLSFKEQEIL